MLQRIYDFMDIPKPCYVGNIIFKKLFYESASLGRADVDIFTKEIDKVIWRYSLKEDTINIKTYRDGEREYEEIAIIEVQLNGDKRVNRIAEIIQRTISYPIILIFSYESRTIINVAHKRLNLADESRNTVVEFIYTSWLDMESLSNIEQEFLKSLNIREFSYTNFYSFYSDIVDRINLFNAAQYLKDYFSLKNKDPQRVKEIKDNLDKIEMELMELRSSIKKENHFNRKMELSIKVRKLEEKKQGLIMELKED